MEAPTESPLPRTVARERRWICEHRWQGVAGGGLCWNSLLASLPLTGNWHRTIKKTPTQRFLNLFFGIVIWVIIGLIMITTQNNNKKSGSVSFVGGCYGFPLGKWSQIHWQCEVNHNYRIDLDVYFQNSFGMGELNRNMSRIYACTSRTSDLNLYKGQPSLKVEIWNYKSSRWTVLEGSSFVRDVVFFIFKFIPRYT